MMRALALPALLLGLVAPAAAQQATIPGSSLGNATAFGPGNSLLCQTPAGTRLCSPAQVLGSMLVQGRTLTARALDVVNAADDGMRCDGVTDDTAALNAAIARSRAQTIFASRIFYGMQIQLPMGRCIVRGVALTLAGNQSLDIAGAGPEMTELLFGNDADGIAVTLNSAGAWLRDSAPGTSGAAVRIRDLALVRTVPSEGRTAITVASTATVNPGARQFTLQNVTMRGVAGASAWQNGYTLTNLTGTLVEDLYFHTAHSTGVGTGTVGTYTTTGSFISTEHHITRGNSQGQQVCYRFGGLIQGVTIDHTSCVGAQTGVIGTSTDGTNDSLLITSSHFDTLQAAFQVSGWNNVSVVNNYLLANNPGSSDTWTGLAATQGARLMFTGNHAFGRAGSAAQSLIAVNNTTGLDSQVSLAATGNAAEFMTGAMVVLAAQTSRASIVGNTCLSCGSLGTDARGASAWASNSVNGTLLMSGLDGALLIGTGVQGRISADGGGSVTIATPNLLLGAANLLLGAGATRASIQADGGGTLTVVAPNTIINNALLLGAGSVRASLTADGGGSFNLTAPNITLNGTVLAKKVPLCSDVASGYLCAVSASPGAAVQVK